MKSDIAKLSTDPCNDGRGEYKLYLGIVREEV